MHPITQRTIAVLTAGSLALLDPAMPREIVSRHHHRLPFQQLPKMLYQQVGIEGRGMVEIHFRTFVER